MSAIFDHVDALLNSPDAELQALLTVVPSLQADIRAMLVLAHLDESPLIPIFP